MIMLSAPMMLLIAIVVMVVSLDDRPASERNELRSVHRRSEPVLAQPYDPESCPTS
jgi:hypothetical protein